MKKLLSFLLSFSLLQASDSLNQKSWTLGIMDKVCTSKAMNLYSKYIQRNIDRAWYFVFGFGSVPASEKYQNMAIEAQKASGMSLDKVLPVFKLNPNALLTNAVLAFAGSNAIYINEENMDKKTYGAARSTLFHEAVHVKNNDASVLGLCRQIGFWGCFGGTCAALKVSNFVKYRKSLSLLAGLVACYNTSSQYVQLMEKRADTQGHYLTNCSTCVRDNIQDKFNQYNDLAKIAVNDPILQKYYPNGIPAVEDAECSRGYLHCDQLEKIAQALGCKKCQYHSGDKLVSIVLK